MSDRLQQIININAPLLEQRTQIIRQRAGNAALTCVPTLHCAKRDVEITGKSGLPAKPVEGFADSGELIAGHFLVTTKVQKIADGTLMLAPLHCKHFSHALINFFRFLVGKNSFSRAVVNDFARVIIKVKIHLIHKERVYVALGLVDGFNLHAVVNGHIGLLTVLSRPVADIRKLVAGHLRQFAQQFRCDLTVVLIQLVAIFADPLVKRQLLPTFLRKPFHEIASGEVRIFFVGYKRDDVAPRVRIKGRRELSVAAANICRALYGEAFHFFKVTLLGVWVINENVPALVRPTWASVVVVTGVVPTVRLAQVCDTFFKKTCHLNLPVKIAETKITGVHQEKIASFLSRSALLVFPDIKRTFFSGIFVSLAASGGNKIRNRFSGLRHVFRLTYPRNFVAVGAAAPDAGCIAKVFVRHLGLLTVLGRPIAVALGHNIATSTIYVKSYS